jgi:hypothetical protein
LVLPRAETKSERAQEAADFGTLVHKWKETGDEGKGRLATTLKKKLKETGVKREEYWYGGLHEVPLAFNVLTTESKALVLPLSSEDKDEWKASFGPEWVVGTADFVGLLLGQPWLDDLKTGREVEWLDYRYQQTFYLMTWTLFSEHELKPGRSTITHWPRYPIPNKPKRFGTVLEVDDYLDFQSKLTRLYKDAAKLREDKENGMDVIPRLTDGAQCVYCPAKTSCIKGQKYE